MITIPNLARAEIGWVNIFSATSIEGSCSPVSKGYTNSTGLLDDISAVFLVFILCAGTESMVTVLKTLSLASLGGYGLAD